MRDQARENNEDNGNITGRNRFKLDFYYLNILLFNSYPSSKNWESKSQIRRTLRFGNVALNV